ncbi:MAG: DUF262 domain-containing protein [Acinetobacter sp.]|uniref:DUF262 domain-containing protein n=1 Tax=Acinetobacter sp. TaxID=472 RepID=UPI003919E334
MSEPQALIKVAVCNVAQLLSGKNIQVQDQADIQGKLTIPEYQRPYVWDIEQLDQLIKDIQEHEQKGKDSPYYLGSIILHAKSTELNIIDGQQRLTSLTLFGYLNAQLQNVSLSYHSSVSVEHIRRNLAYLHSNKAEWEKSIDLEKIVVSLVVTSSEDDAYKFFETQNTGGVRLSGIDIIKAYHLRAINSEQQKRYQTFYAKKWESLGELSDTVWVLLLGRYWNYLNRQQVPYYKNKMAIKNAIIDEFSKKTRNGTEDIAYSQININYSPVNRSSQISMLNSYNFRQSLNAGINTISYLEYFQQLYLKYYKNLDIQYLYEYYNFTSWLKQLQGCRFLAELYVIGILLYVSKFGEYKLDIFAKKFFRVAYSRRATNQTRVRADTVPKFIEETNLLDHVVMAYRPEDLFEKLDSYKFDLKEYELDEKKKSLRKTFIQETIKYFGLNLKSEEIQQCFFKELTLKIKYLDKK